MKKRSKHKFNPYKEANEVFLSRKAMEDDVVVLESGVMYKKLVSGSGTKCPGPTSLVYVYYSGKLIDGSVFDSNVKDATPALFPLRDLIMGWQIALVRMHEGDKWEVYIPAKHGYGSHAAGDIPAHSTLIFTIELVKIERY